MLSSKIGFNAFINNIHEIVIADKFHFVSFNKYIIFNFYLIK